MSRSRFQDRAVYHRTPGPAVGAPDDGLEGCYSAVIQKAPTGGGTTCQVVVNTLDGQRYATAFISGGFTVSVGDVVLVAFDEFKRAWVVSGSTDSDPLPTLAQLGIARGSGTVTFSGTTNSATTTIAHGLGAVPGYVGATNTAGNGIYFSISKTSTQLQVIGWYVSAATGTFPFDWIAVL